MSTELSPNQSEQEAAQQVAQLVRTRQELKAAGAEFASIDEQIKPYRTLYVKSGARYGGNFAGMLKWFQERAGG